MDCYNVYTNQQMMMELLIYYLYVDFFSPVYDNFRTMYRREFKKVETRFKLPMC